MLDSINAINEFRIKLLKHQLIDFDSINSTLSVMLSNSNTVINTQTVRQSNYNSQIRYWKKAFKKQKRQKYLVGGISLILLVLLAF